MRQGTKESIRWLSKRNMPWPELRDDFNWVGPYLHCVELSERIETLQSEHDQVQQLARSLPDVKKDFQNSWEMVESHKNRELQQFIIHFSGGPDPCGQLRHIQAPNWLTIPTISEQAWINAFAELEKSWPQEAISDADRKKQISQIDKKISGLKKELVKYTDLPKWQEFTDHWRAMQASCTGAINPSGFEIQTSPPEEIEAFKALGLGQLVSESNRFYPARD
jgi:hypothetical protein